MHSTSDLNPPKKQFYNRPYSSLDVRDISETRAQGSRSRSSHMRNPINPTYNLPSVPPAIYPEPKFLRDSMAVEDIPGARPRLPSSNIHTRYPNPLDIPDSRPRPRTRTRVRFGEESEPQEASFVSKRATNPLSPRYQYPAAADNYALSSLRSEKPHTRMDPKMWAPTTESEVAYGGVEKNHPRVVRSSRRPEENFSLNTSDIPGGTVGYKQWAQPPRREWRQVNVTKDIPGAQADTRETCMRTRRHINPITREYDLTSWIGEGMELKNPVRISSYELFLQKRAALRGPSQTEPTPEDEPASTPEPPAASTASAQEVGVQPEAQQSTAREPAVEELHPTAPEPAEPEPAAPEPAETKPEPEPEPEPELAEPEPEPEVYKNGFFYPHNSVPETIANRSQMYVDIGPTTAQQYAMEQSTRPGPGYYNTSDSPRLLSMRNSRSTSSLRGQNIPPFSQTPSYRDPRLSAHNTRPQTSHTGISSHSQTRPRGTSRGTARTSTSLAGTHRRVAPSYNAATKADIAAVRALPS